MSYVIPSVDDKKVRKILHPVNQFYAALNSVVVYGIFYAHKEFWFWTLLSVALVPYCQERGEIDYDER